MEKGIVLAVIQRYLHVCTVHPSSCYKYSAAKYTTVNLSDVNLQFLIAEGFKTNRNQSYFLK